MTDWYTSPCVHPNEERPDSINISIQCGNDAFMPFWNIEAARILQGLTQKLMEGEGIPCKLHDTNGNRVGIVKIE